MDRWLGGREITSARSQIARVPAARLIGQRVECVEARGKHLMMRFTSGLVLHTHMRMSGSWHVYGGGERWRRPGHQASLVLETADRVAVCFNAPVIELLAAGDERVHRGLHDLGPDVLSAPLDLAEIRRRARSRSGSTIAGDLLLDQRVVAGIGNIWRCESLFLEGVHPMVPVSGLDDADIDRLVKTAARLMSASVGGDRPERLVYRRTGRPCRRCGRPIRSAVIGEQARRAYWCPSCQPPTQHAV